ncbi:MAG: TonB-dependent receptor family protein [Marinifilaceae bacterium]|jgi:outer membrane receptor protein involved in Fe transport|nr:TonB-dependent receptor family protein [Marinifilaceae bacterium]
MNTNIYFKIGKTIIFIVLYFSILATKAIAVETYYNINGYVKDSKSKQGLAFATVQVLNPKDSSLVKATITNFDGKFSFQLAKANYLIIASYTGYSKTSKKLVLGNKNQNLILFLDSKTERLSEISVVGEKKVVDQKIHKTVINVQKDNTTAGGSAIDVLQNIPFVSIDMNGKLNYRSSDKILVLINNNISALSNSLDQLSIDQIERIELVNNPSAKYDSEGSSGIINIVLKNSVKNQNKIQYKFNIGHDETLAATLGYFVLNKKSQFMVNAGYSHKKQYQTKEHFRDNYANPNAYNYYQYDRQDSRINSSMLNASYKYNISQKHKIGFSFVGSNKNNNADRAIDYKSIDKAEVLNSESRKNIKIDLDNYMLDGIVDYHFKLNDKNKIDSKVHYSYFDQSLGMNNILSTTDQNSQKEHQNTISNQYNNIFDFQIDYSSKLNDDLLLEMGYKNQDKSLLNKFDSQSLDNSTGKWQNDNLANNFDFHENINSLYFVLNYNIHKWKFQTGLRTEYTLKNQSAKSEEEYIEFFPSVSISRKYKKSHTAFLTYSRRINRPNIKMLNPYFGEYADMLNRHKGNPELKPEIVNIMELGNRFSKGKISGKLSVYSQFIDNAISRVKSAVNDSALVVSYLNLDRANHSGLELYMTYNLFRNWNFNFSGDLFYTKLEGSYHKNKVDKDRTGWNISMNNNFKLFNGIKMQVNGHYRSKVVSALEVYKQRYYVDLAINKKIMKNKAILNFRISDLFDTNSFRPIVDATDDRGNRYSQTNERKIESRYFIMSFVYNINKKAKKSAKKKAKFFLDGLVK